ncbi:MAG: MFS transporter, partial [Dermatophilaceae bacterium]
MVAGRDAAPVAPPSLRVVWLMVAATFVVFLNETTMSVALRPIMLDLGVDARTGQWLTTAFMLTMAVVIPV